MIPHPTELVQGAILGSMIVLNFHLIGKPQRELAAGEAEVSVDPEQFTEILDLLVGRNDVRLTFDDGNKSDVTVALPELTRRGLRADFFICPARFGSPGFVDADDIRELREAGMTVGSHGMDHVPWRRLKRSAIEREIVEAKRVLEATLQASVDTAACPFGTYDHRTLSALRAAGFTRVYTSDGGRANPEAWLVARNTVRRSDSRESVEKLLVHSGAGASLMRRAKQVIKRLR